MEELFKNLNNKQIEAIQAINGPVLVISGPGSGKTRCLTHRIAYLISQGIKANEILAITFTNKAASEIKDRVNKLLSAGLESSVSFIHAPTLGTFHSVCLRILRKEIPILGYKSSFSILDTDDQLGLVKKVMTEIEVDTKRYNPRLILNKISRLKSTLIFPENYNPTDFFSKIISREKKSVGL